MRTFSTQQLIAFVVLMLPHLLGGTESGVESERWLPKNELVRVLRVGDILCISTPTKPNTTAAVYVGNEQVLYVHPPPYSYVNVVPLDELMAKGSLGRVLNPLDAVFEPDSNEQTILDRALSKTGRFVPAEEYDKAGLQLGAFVRYGQNNETVMMRSMCLPHFRYLE